MECQPLTAIDETLELSCRPMAEAGAFAACEDSGQPPRLLSDRAMTDCVDATVNRLQASGGLPAMNLIGAETEPEQLPEGDDPMLSTCESSDGLRH